MRPIDRSAPPSTPASAPRTRTPRTSSSSSGGTPRPALGTATEYVDHGVSGAKDRRPALDRLMADAASRKIDVVVCWRLDRFGRNLRHLVVCNRGTRRVLAWPSCR